MDKAQVGTGVSKEFGKMSGAKTASSSRDSDGERQNCTKRAYTKKCSNLHGPFGPGLAGGNFARFEELRKHSAGNTPDAGVHDEGNWDSLSGQSAS